MSSRNRTLLLVACACLVLAIVILARGWIRNGALPLFANATTGKSVTEAQHSSFSKLNSQLSHLGIHFPHRNSNDPACFTGNYHWQHVTILCIDRDSIANGDGNRPTPQSLVDNWPSILATINGTKDPAWNVDKTNTNIANLHNMFVFSGTSRNYLAYTRDLGKVECSLQFGADPAYANYTSSFYIDEGCVHNIRIFGGWDCTVNQYCKP